MKLILCKDEAREWIISADAYHYLKDEEPMLDDDNMAEAEEIESFYPHGYKILDSKYIDEQAHRP